MAKGSAFAEGVGAGCLQRPHHEPAVALLSGEVVQFLPGTGVERGDEGRSAVDGLRGALGDIQRPGH